MGVATASSVDWGTGTGSIGANLLMSFGDWNADFECGTPEISNFNTAPYKAFVPGLVGGTMTCDCPGYNQGNMPLTVGNAYQVTLGWTNSINLVGVGILKKLTAANKADGAPTVKANWQLTGVFTAAIT